MRIGATNIHPAGIVVAALNFVAGLIAVAACVYGLWFILSDWAHITFTRIVGLIFCLWLGALALAMTAHRIRLWRHVLFLRD